MAEIVPVVSEALEAQVRDLLPSQRGFGEDLQASNVITPIIDLTRAAQGTTTPELLQTALAFGSQTSSTANNSTATMANTAGFWRITAGVAIVNETAAAQSASIGISDGLGTKNVYQWTVFPTAQAIGLSELADFVVFLRSGDSLTITSTSTCIYLNASVRQIADVNGTLVNPSGFTPQ